jgi:hypothetical protein
MTATTYSSFLTNLYAIHVRPFLRRLYWIVIFCTQITLYLAIPFAIVNIDAGISKIVLPVMVIGLVLTFIDCLYYPYLASVVYKRLPKAIRGCLFGLSLLFTLIAFLGLITSIYLLHHNYSRLWTYPVTLGGMLISTTFTYRFARESKMLLRSLKSSLR